MKLITRFALAAYSKEELQGLYRRIFNELAQSNPNTIQHMNALASLENIRREIAFKMRF